MFADALEKVLHCPLERDRALAPLTTLGIGGRAECYLEPRSLADFQAVYAMSAQMGFPVHILGGGSNVLFADGVIPGVVLSMRKWNAVRWPEPTEEGTRVDVQTGYPLPALLTAVTQRGLGGLEFAAGIPGTVGGAVAGNAGAGGRSVGEFLLEVVSLEHGGTLKVWERGTFTCAYRSCSLAGGGRILLSCVLLFRAAREADIEGELARFRSMRQGQPAGRSAGCSFKNPPGHSAGRLLDQCGCRGMSMGDAVVSSQHANFILNRGGASSADVVSLVRVCRERVLRETGILLEPEIKFLGPAEAGFF